MEPPLKSIQHASREKLTSWKNAPSGFAMKQNTPVAVHRRTSWWLSSQDVSVVNFPPVGGSNGVTVIVQLISVILYQLTLKNAFQPCFCFSWVGGVNSTCKNLLISEFLSCKPLARNIISFTFLFIRMRVAKTQSLGSPHFSGL